MLQHNFNRLFDRYPSIISQMPDRFDSHELIIHLAQENQKLYSLSRFQRARSAVYGRTWHIGKASE